MEEDTFTMQSNFAQKKNELLDLKRLLNLFIRRWYFFPGFLIITVSLVFVYNRYTKPIFITQATILIDDDKSESFPGEDQILKGVGLKSSTKNIENQIYILSSFTLVE